MPASDPTADVPTPTGTLQGVAAFSWDGAAWQPAGRAGPSVATPTGVLRGVAAFNGGPAWQPAGQAQPGVATPTGTLDGVAVYTWSGSAWTPPGGTATPSTPHGALRGVAAFNWDGAAWQPASQAGPSVGTPYGVLDGVAMFGWSGSAWAAVGAPSLSLDFMTPGVLDPRITFTRASTATYFNSSGVMLTAAANAPRWDYNPNTLALNGLLIEEARTNLLLNSASLGTQGVAVTAQAYTLSFYGTGTVTMSGAFAGSLVGTGVFPARVQTTFTPAAGTLTCTVTGSVLNAQLEAGSFVTSWISTTAAAVTRAVDVCTMPVAAWFNQTTGSTAAVEYSNLAQSSGGVSDDLFAFNDASGNANNSIFSFAFVGAGTTTAVSEINSGGSNTGYINYGGIPTSPVGKQAVKWITNGQFSQTINGGVVQAGTVTSVSPTVSQLAIGAVFGGAGALNGCVRRVRYWPRVLSDAEMQQVTT